MNKSVFVKLLLLSLIPVTAALIFIYGFQYMPASAKSFDTNLHERIKTLALFAVPQIIKPIKFSDDVGMLLTMENIMKVNDISSVYVLDNTGKVLAHDKVSQWGKIYEDKLSEKAMEASKEGFITLGADEAYVSKIGLSTLIFKINTDRKQESAKLLQKNILYSCIALLSLSFLFFFILFNNNLKKKFKMLEETLKSISLGNDGKINSFADDEFGSVSKLIDDVINRFAQTTKEITIASSRHEMKSILAPIIENVKNGVIVIDSENRVVVLNKNAKDFLGIDPDKNYFENHVLDVFSDSAMMDLIREAVSKKLGSFETKYHQMPVKIVLPLNKSGSSAGMVIFIG